MVMVLTLVNLAPDTRHVVMAEAARRKSSVLRTKQHSRKRTKGRKMGTRVLVVDDSITMRALFTDVLERSSGISVVGAAANADEARDMIAELKPDVLTLDVEMPGKSGLEFLEELMESKPMPVVMLSTLTQKGAQDRKSK